MNNKKTITKLRAFCLTAFIGTLVGFPGMVRAAGECIPQGPYDICIPDTGLFDSTGDIVARVTGDIYLMFGLLILVGIGLIINGRLLISIAKGVRK